MIPLIKRWNTAYFPLVKASLFLLFCLTLVASAQTQLELQVLQETNAARAAHGLPPLAWDENAARAARDHARDMLERGYFAHNTPEGITPAERMWAAGVYEVEVGENIAYYEGYTPQQAVAKAVDDWMHSPPHRENILRPEFTHLGVGIAVAGDRVMLVQDFLARPYEVVVWQTPSRALMGILSYSGSSKATVGVFVNGVFNTALQPPDWNGKLELAPGSRVSLGLWRGTKYYLVCEFVLPEVECHNPKINWRASYRQEFKNTVRLQINLPPGDYTLAYGSKTPVPFRKAKGQVFIEVPRDWGAIWIGVKRGDRVEYTHRIPLE
ncbi:CAP domain-containing protein [Oceanithermus sp.]